MPANKNQIRRMQVLLKMMRKSAYPNHTSFIREMQKEDIAFKGISSKTLQRDIADLRDEYGAPVKYDAVRQGYYLEDTDWYNADLMVEPFDMKAFLLGERVTDGILPAPLRSAMNKAVNALVMKNENGMAEGAELENFQILCSKYLPQVDPDIFLLCYNAWEEHKRVRLTYNSAQKKHSLKLFEPHILAWQEGRWYLKGKLLKDNDTSFVDDPPVRVLALHRIESAELLNSRFDPAPEILQSLKLRGLFDFTTLPDVEVEIFAPFDLLLYEKYENTPGAVKERKADSVVLHLHNLNEYEAAQLVLKTCGNAKIYNPPELKEYVRQIARKLLSNLE